MTEATDRLTRSACELTENPAMIAAMPALHCACTNTWTLIFYLGSQMAYGVIEGYPQHYLFMQEDRPGTA